jgi:N6-L-threonylcarbamoyladenine synthase
LLLVSGGHCQFISVNRLGDYTRLGTTIDDAAGEAFDKTAKLLGLGFPGGPALEEAAKTGDASSVKLPRPLLDRPGLDMSFAGLKTAARRAVEAEPLNPQRQADIAASFQQAITDALSEKTPRAMAAFERGDAEGMFVVAGGVAANQLIRDQLKATASHSGFQFLAPPLKYCTDNAPMIALAGAMHFKAGARGDLNVAARPRWPLDEAQALANPVLGHGKKGVKV